MKRGRDLPEIFLLPLSLFFSGKRKGRGGGENPVDRGNEVQEGKGETEAEEILMEASATNWRWP